MPLVPCSCTNCGAALEVDNTLEAAMCKFCGTPFIVEKAIYNYNIKNVNINMEQKDVNALIKKGQRILKDINFNANELFDVADTLSELSTDDFYSEFFFYACGKNDNTDFINKATEEQKIEVAEYLFKAIARDYHKESFDDVKLNIKKNYIDVLWESEVFSDQSIKSYNFLSMLTSVFTPKMALDWDRLKTMAEEELTELANNIDSVKLAICIEGYSRKVKVLVSDDTRELVLEKVKEYASNAPSDDFQSIVRLSRVLKESLFKVKIAKDSYLTFTDIIFNDKTYPVENVLANYFYDGVNFYLVKINETDAVVIKPAEPCFKPIYDMVLPNCKQETYTFFDNLSDYKVKKIEGYNLNLVFIEGLSYKKSFFDKFTKTLRGILK